MQIQYTQSHDANSFLRVTKCVYYMIKQRNIFLMTSKMTT